MIYIDITKITKQFRKGLAVTNADRDDDVLANIKNFETVNNCRVVGSLDAGGYWCTDGLEFSDEKTLMWFKLKWA